MEWKSTNQWSTQKARQIRPHADFQTEQLYLGEWGGLSSTLHYLPKSVLVPLSFHYGIKWPLNLRDRSDSVR